MQEGTVKFFNEAKGFGFITPADGSKDVFVHSSGLISRSIQENDRVVFEVQQGQKRLKRSERKIGVMPNVKVLTVETKDIHGAFSVSQI